jgi:hypothetical protein
MKNSHRYSWKPIAGKVFIPLFFGCVVFLAASAETPTAATDKQTLSETPLNLNSDIVVKEMSQEQQSVDSKPNVLSSDQNLFEQSILNSENRKKISGLVEAGAGVGSMPVQRGIKTDKMSCEYTGAAIVDELSKTTQLGVAAQVSTCKTR